MTPEMTQVLGAAATVYGLGGALSVLLQARQMYVRGRSCDVSARFLTVYVGGFAIWLLYGLGIESFPIILVHAVGLVCGTITLSVLLWLRRPVPVATADPSAGEDPPERLRPGQAISGESDRPSRRPGRWLPTGEQADGSEESMSRWRTSTQPCA
jgi:uncharacterized protein with PQ loop repeat